jgi:hypothetical protein
LDLFSPHRSSFLCSLPYGCNNDLSLTIFYYLCTFVSIVPILSPLN